MNRRLRKAGNASAETSRASLPLPRDVVRAIACLRGHVGEPVLLDRLAEVAGVRPRTLEAHFRAFLGTTPRAFARRLRLAHARAQLQRADSKADVTAIALSSGFNQPGRFAGEYRRRFGELPSQTQRRARRVAIDHEADLDDEAILLTWRAIPAAFAVAPNPCSEALEYAARAQALAPDYALPKAIASWCLRQRTVLLSFRSPDTEAGELACGLAQEACSLAPDHALVLTLAAGALSLSRRLDEADRLIERALAIEPSAAWAWARRGWLSAYQGDDGDALREFRMALELMPFEPIRHLVFIGVSGAHFNAGRYERAAAWAVEGVNACPDSFWALRIAAAAASHAGRNEEARRIVRYIRRRDPDLTVTEARSAWPFQAAFMDRLGDGLARAGLPY